MQAKSKPKPKRKRPTRLAVKLLELRNKLHLSQGGMLRRLGLENEMERDYISKFERGVLDPPLHVLCAYGEAANIFLDVLVRDDIELPEVLPAKTKSEGVRSKAKSTSKELN